MKESTKVKVRTAVIIVALVIIFFGLLYVELVIDRLVWNRGYCENCGGKYVFANGSRTKSGGSIYFYSCEKCGDVIRLSFPMEREER